MKCRIPVVHGLLWISGVVLAHSGYATTAFHAIDNLPGAGASTPMAISESGLRVVGQSERLASVFDAFGWTIPSSAIDFWPPGTSPVPPAGGTFPLATFLAPGDSVCEESDAYSICAEESVVVGDAKDQSLTWRAVRWTKSGVRELEAPAGGWAGQRSAVDVSKDGSVVVGFARYAGANPGFRGFRWFRPAAGPAVTEYLLQNSADSTVTASFAYSVSQDGGTICGSASFAVQLPHACAWRSVSPGGPLAFEVVSNAFSSADATGDDGRIVAGWIVPLLDEPPRACYWRRQGATWSQPVFLGTLAGFPGSVVSAVSNDGSVMGGYGVTADFEDSEAFVWFKYGPLAGMHSVSSLLDAAGLADASGWKFGGVSGLVFDPQGGGTLVLAGDGIDPESHSRGWHARIEHVNRLRPSQVQVQASKGPEGDPVGAGIPPATTLYQPLEASGGGPVQIRYRVASGPVPVRISIYDIRGRDLWSSSDSVVDPGEHTQTWNRQDRAGGRVTRGVYFVRFKAGGVSESKRLILLRR